MPPSWGRPVRTRWRVIVRVGVRTNRTVVRHVYATSEASARFRALAVVRADGYTVTLSDITECELV
jgi:hypothetical protein